MPNKKVTLYQSVKRDGRWTYQKAATRPKRLREGSYYVSWYVGKVKQMLPVGCDPDVAVAAVKRKEAELKFIAAGGEIKQPPESDRTLVSTAVNEYIEDCRDRQGKSGYGLAKTTVEAYKNRLSFFTEFMPTGYLDEVDERRIRDFSRSLLRHEGDMSDRTRYNIVQAVKTFLLKHDNKAANPVLKEMGFPPTEVIPYSLQDMAKFFSVCDEREKLTFQFFLHSMCREREVAHCEVRDLLFESGVLHISPKPQRGFRLKGKRSGQAKKGRKVPINSKLMSALREYCRDKSQSALLFPNPEGGVENHFLRQCKAIAERAGIKDHKKWTLHRWRKTGATRHHEDGVSVRKIQAWLGHESLAVTLEYLGVEDAADEYSQEQVNSGSLAAFA